MGVFRLIYTMYKIRLLSPSRLYGLISAVCKYGINIMTLLSFAGKAYADKIALVDEHETISYKELLLQSERLSILIREKYQIKSGQKVGFICKNHTSLVKSLFAVSLLGADMYLFNAEMSSSQFSTLMERYDFDLLIYDYQLGALVEGSNYTKGKVISYHDCLPAINNLLNMDVNRKMKFERTFSGKIVLLTGGTTGNSKEAAHKPSLFNYLNPFLNLITRLKLINYNTAYIATPIYHGYGIAVLLLLIALGKKVIINNGFNAQKACSLIRKHNVEVVTVVPLMIYKMLKNSPEDLKCLSCIVSGGAELNPKLVDEVLSKLGNVLYNLYGTSEAGLNMVATPEDLKYSPNTIGKIINGVKLKVMDSAGREVSPGSIGQFCIKNKWSMRNSTSSWIKTGDLGYRDTKGYYFLCGRVDDMVVSAGENVYPLEIEQVLVKHPQIEDAAAIGVSDESFGQRLKVFVLPVKNSNITKDELFEWLRSRVARFQVPKDIIFIDEMPYTVLGKLDKKQLK